MVHLPSPTTEESEVKTYPATQLCWPVRYLAWAIFIALLMCSSGANLLAAHIIEHCGGDLNPWMWLLFPFESWYPETLRFERDLQGQPILFGMNYLGLDVPWAFIVILWERVMCFYVVLPENMPKLMHYPEFRDSMVSVITALLNTVTLGVIVFWWGSYLDRYIWNNFRVTDLFADPRSPLSFWPCFFVFDFVFYWLHRWDHIFSWLWSHHVSHHSSDYYDLSVAVRRNAFDFMTPHYLISSIGLSFLFPPLLTAAIYQLQLIMQNWIHTQLIPPFPRIMEIIFNTPSAHRVHHAKNEDVLGKNYGAVFLVWDYLFGTHEFETAFGEAKGREIHYGIIPPLVSWNPISVQFHQFYYMLCVQTKWHGFSAPFRHWTPPGGRCPKLGSRLNPKKKLGEDSSQSTGLKLFIVFQFCLMSLLSFVSSSMCAKRSNQEWFADLVGISVFASHNLLYSFSFVVGIIGFVNLSGLMSAESLLAVRRALLGNICFHSLVFAIIIAMVALSRHTGTVRSLSTLVVTYAVLNGVILACSWWNLVTKPSLISQRSPELLIKD
jgi:sterol desaturase/sphingolipid hydroxylase (fatty acid hydroxylase superfamily)